MAESISQATMTEAPENGHQPEVRTIISYNPVTQERLGEVVCATPEKIADIMRQARKAQAMWAGRPLEERIEMLKALQAAMYRHFDELVALMVSEQGKAPTDAVLEVLATLEIIRYHVRHTKRVLKPQRLFIPLAPHRRHIIERHPYGVVLVISPWNFPVNLPMTSIVAALIAGNSVILKPSEFVTQISELLAKLIHEAGIPEGVFQMAHGYGDVGAALIAAHPDKICFIGSDSTGRKIAAKAGEMLIPVTLELGGKDAAIVLEDANIKRAARGILWAGTLNAGQACLSIERVYVIRSVADKLINEMKSVIDHYIHPGVDERATYGAITTETQLKIIQQQVDEAVAQKAKIIRGNQQVEGRFYPTTLVTEVSEDLRIVTEETFGPVIVVIPVDSETEAVKRANDSRFGLVGSVWTDDRRRGLRLLRQLEVGVASVNDHYWSTNTAEMPWGGVKASGYGRTRGREGLLDMTIAKSLSYDRFHLPFEPFWIPYTALKRAFMRRFVDFRFGPTWRDKIKALKRRG